jgi:Tfp pilus assembly protein PilX
LPVVLLIASMMLTTSAAWFEASLAAARGVADLRDTLQAFHAADSALTICAQAVLAGTAPVTARVANGTEPVTWKLAAAFAAGAFAPFAQWPGSARPPQCLVEAWRLSARPEVPAYLVTARGFGRNEESQAWLQVELVVDGDTVERHWRRVAARPF